MAQLIVEITGDTLGSVSDALALVVSSGTFELRVLLTSEMESLNYKPLALSLEEALRDLSSGKVASVVVYPASSTVHYANINTPNFCGDSFPYWTADIELKTTSFEALYTQLMRIEDLRVISISLEEGLELGTNNIEPNSFPWLRENLVIAAVKQKVYWHVRVGKGFELLDSYRGVS